ncbi:MAG: twin-arginine translocation signal domain-containing protein, partial [Xanthobacteraceae bacterium]
MARRATLVPGPAHEGGGLDRRAFLRRSGLIAGALGTLGALPLGSVRNAEAGPPAAPGSIVT